MKVTLNDIYDQNSMPHGVNINSVHISFSVDDNISESVYSSICDDIKKNIDSENTDFVRIYLLHLKMRTQANAGLENYP